MSRNSKIIIMVVTLLSIILGISLLLTSYPKKHKNTQSTTSNKPQKYKIIPIDKGIGDNPGV